MKNSVIPQTDFLLVAKVNQTVDMSSYVYDYVEKYNHDTEKLDEGTYWMGSKSSNTRCNKFTLIGSDKTQADDTKERK
jgi:hypothetical protein